MSELIHTTKDGQQMRLSDIGDNHLANIIAFLKRNINSKVGKNGVYEQHHIYVGMEPGDDFETSYYSKADLEVLAGLPGYEAEQARRKRVQELKILMDLPQYEAQQQLTGVKQ